MEENSQTTPPVEAISLKRNIFFVFVSAAIFALASWCLNREVPFIVSVTVIMTPLCILLIAFLTREQYKVVEVEVEEKSPELSLLKHILANMAITSPRLLVPYIWLSRIYDIAKTVTEITSFVCLIYIGFTKELPVDWVVNAFAVFTVVKVLRDWLLYPRILKRYAANYKNR